MRIARVSANNVDVDLLQKQRNTLLNITNNVDDDLWVDTLKGVIGLCDALLDNYESSE